VINSNLGPYLAPFSRNTSVTDRQTGGQTDGRQLIPIARPLLKYSRLKIRMPYMQK